MWYKIHNIFINIKKDKKVRAVHFMFRVKNISLKIVKYIQDIYKKYIQDVPKILKHP